MILLNALLSSAEEFVKIGSEAWKNNIFASLEIMWKGVLAIFVVKSRKVGRFAFVVQDLHKGH